MAEDEGLTERQKRLSLACTLAQEYLALGLPPPEATRKLASKHFGRLHSCQCTC